MKLKDAHYQNQSMYILKDLTEMRSNVQFKLISENIIMVIFNSLESI